MPEQSFAGALQSVRRGMAWISFAVVCTCTIAEQVGPTDAAKSGHKRPVSVAYSIAMTQGPQIAPVAHFSPDGKKFAVVIRRGNLQQNTNEYSLLLWRTDHLSTSSKPEILLTMSSASNRAAIDEDVSWLQDNETIVFTGERTSDTAHQVYACNIGTRVLRELTSHGANVLSYSADATGSKVVFLAEEPEKTIPPPIRPGDAITITSEWILDLLLNRQSTVPDNPKLFVQSHGRETSVTIPWAISSFTKATVSPDGRYLLLTTNLTNVPLPWRNYGSASRDYGNRRIREWVSSAPRQRSNLQRYGLIELSDGSSRILLDSPIGWPGSQAAWSPDSRSVVLSNVYLPFNSASDEENKSRQTETFVVEVAVPSGEFTKISNEDLRLLQWDAGSGLLVFSIGRNVWKPGSAVAYRKSAGVWTKVDAFIAFQRPEIAIEQNLNVPPRLVVRGVPPAGDQVLLDLNPQFRTLDFAKEEVITWNATDGREATGGLYYPIGYAPGFRYPLVIQTHGFDSGVFWIDGPFTTAVAAQSLAGRGIMVVQVRDTFEDIGTPHEIATNVAGYEGLIRYLEERQLIDRSRIGIIGFSRTALYVKYALSHTKIEFAAASITDGFDGGYVPYMLTLNSTENDNPWEAVNGGIPFASGLDSWISRSPIFHVREVHAPVRIVALNTWSLVGEWEWFAALRRLHKPVDFVYVRDGSHILQRPWDRMVSQQGNVDWFDFWLNDREDPDPAKADQYARWRELRKLQEENEKKSVAPAN